MNLSNSYFLLGLSVIIAVAGQILFKFASTKMITESFNLKNLLTNLPLIFGMFLYFLSSMIYIVSLKNTPLSIAYPTTAIGYVLVVILSYFVFSEAITVFKMLGVILILSGVSLMWK